MSEQYDDLILKSLDGTLTSEEQKTLEQWIQQSPENKQQMESFKAIWKATNSKTSVPDFSTLDEWQRLKEKTVSISSADNVERQRAMWVPIYKIAAAAAVLILAAVAVRYFSNDHQDQPKYTKVEAHGVVTTVSLPDGSTVVLNKTGELIYDNRFNETERAVSFKGEAFFDIAKNPEKKFIIKTSNTAIEVLGTSFNVRAMEQETNTSVYVVTGKVKVSDNNASMITLVPGETGTYNQSNHVLEKSLAEDGNALAWRDRKLNFKATRLHKVVTSVEQYFGVQIKLEGEKLGECRFTSSFDNPTLEEVIEAISVSLDLEFKSTGINQYTIIGKGCP
jgi:ferric-dicitrate binding protein FerR (iron transport regulator)